MGTLPARSAVKEKSMRQLMRTAALGLLVVAALASAVEAGNPGDAGFLSLRMGIGARNGAMGDVGVAESPDANAMYYNPANMVLSEGTDVTLQHLEHFGLFNQESAVVSHRLESGAIGLIFSGFYSETLERTTIDRVGVSQGEFQPYQMMVGLGYAHAFRDFSVGVVGKYLYERIDAYSASGLALDLGITHRSKIAGLTLAAAVANLGDPMTLDQEPYDLPLTVRFGASFTPRVGHESMWENLTVATDVLLPNDGNGRLLFGAEFRLNTYFALRGGYRANYDTYGLTAGAGFRKGLLSVDYAYMENDNDLQDNHRFSLGFAFQP
jgi:hypothetical protein